MYFMLNLKKHFNYSSDLFIDGSYKLSRFIDFLFIYAIYLHLHVSEHNSIKTNNKRATCMENRHHDKYTIRCKGLFYFNFKITAERHVTKMAAVT